MSSTGLPTNAATPSGRNVSHTRRLDGDARFVWARSGDHVAVGRLLLAIFQSPSPDEFQASLDDPFYEPTDRLLVKRGGRIASHLQLIKRTMHYGRQRLAVSRISHLCTLPEFRSRGYAGGLLSAADEQIAEDGGVLALLTTDIPKFFSPRGWAVCGRDSFSQASTRDVLSVLSSRTPRFSLRRRRKLNIRHWRQFELSALEQVYRHNTADSLGPLDRSETYWQWLLSLRSFDHVFVAIDGPDRLQFGEDASPIVGYAVTRGEDIVELMGAPTHPDAPSQLLARACSEAIERDLHSISLHSPPDDPLHELIVTAGGRYSLNHPGDGRVHMAKLVDPDRFFEKICPELHRRAVAARLPRPCELGLVFGGKSYRFACTRRSVRVVPGETADSCVLGERAELTGLVLGQFDWPAAEQAGRIEFSDEAARRIARAVFPRQFMWRPPFDQMAV